MIIYEYPFNERIRNLLRLEDLHEKFTFFQHQKYALDHQIALATIFEMLDVVGRADLKSDLLQELERQKQVLAVFKSNPHVEAEKLDTVLAKLEETSAALAAEQGRTGQTIRDNEWLMSIRGRTVMPGGASEFDIPAYYAWQQQSFEKRFDNISVWFAPMRPLFNAIELVLRLLRDSGQMTTLKATAGHYQQMLQGKTYQMLRLSLDPKRGVIPEISANKYMLWVRFTTQDGDQKPKPFENDVPFELTLCNF